jgi:hypothetical protein
LARGGIWVIFTLIWLTIWGRVPKLIAIMAWVSLKFSRSGVDEAGRILAKPQDHLDKVLWASEVIDNWRSSHSLPLNTLQIGLRNRAKSVDPKHLVAQRIKRRWSIYDKLKRMKRLSLSEMQDIGGCRAIVSSVPRVRELVSMCKKSRHKHELIDFDDYIQNPKRSGYRSYHLIYRYQSSIYPIYNGLKIEVQVRSRLQHAWATAVETVGTFTRQALKSSSGQADWLTFFALMGTAIAIREKTEPVPNTPTEPAALRDALRSYVHKLDVITKLTGFNQALELVLSPSSIGSPYRLIVLDSTNKKLSITSYGPMDLELAFRDYSAQEQEVSKDSSLDAVLVAVNSMKQLRKAYPNYFLDTSAFVGAVRQAIGE